jgi:hypothetical protein
VSEPYRPSNGAEGEHFMTQFCYRCWHDRNEDCAILANTFSLATYDPLYQKEWIEDDQGPRCTKFAAQEPKILPADEAVQLSLELEAKP